MWLHEKPFCVIAWQNGQRAESPVPLMSPVIKITIRSSSPTSAQLKFGILQTSKNNNTRTIPAKSYPTRLTISIGPRTDLCNLALQIVLYTAPTAKTIRPSQL